MCFSSLVLSRRPDIFKEPPQPLKNPLTPISSCQDLHIDCNHIHKCPELLNATSLNPQRELRPPQTHITPQPWVPRLVGSHAWVGGQPGPGRWYWCWHWRAVPTPQRVVVQTYIYIYIPYIYAIYNPLYIIHIIYIYINSNNTNKKQNTKNKHFTISKFIISSVQISKS